jgi:hypothetical protein
MCPSMRSVLKFLANNIRIFEHPGRGAARRPGPAEKRQLIDQLYSSMIQIGQHGKAAMKDIDAGLERARP